MQKVNQYIRRLSQQNQARGGGGGAAIQRQRIAPTEEQLKLYDDLVILSILRNLDPANPGMAMIRFGTIEQLRTQFNSIINKKIRGHFESGERYIFYLSGYKLYIYDKFGGCAYIIKDVRANPLKCKTVFLRGRDIIASEFTNTFRPPPKDEFPRGATIQQKLKIINENYEKFCQYIMAYCRRNEHTFDGYPKMSVR